MLRALPRWFGLEKPLRAYVEEAAVHPTYVARDGDLDVGFATLKRHTPVVTGFLPLEELDAVWGPANPCLILERVL